MKSLKDNPLTHKFPKIFTSEIIKWLENEGFEITRNNSYCDKLTDRDYESMCFYKACDKNTSYHIGVYIFSFAIGVDVDYDCGGNSSTYLWQFESYTFEEAYDMMVDQVNKYKE